MKKVLFAILAFGLLTTSVFAKKVKVCNVVRNYDISTLKLACEGNWDDQTTLKALYTKGWKYVGTAVGPAGGQVVILEK